MATHRFELTEQDEDRTFEAEVRRIADSLWPDSTGGAAVVGGRERDGVYESEETVHLIEATTSKLLSKAKFDLEKLVELLKRYKSTRADKVVKAWWITRHVATGAQIQEHQRMLKEHKLTKAELSVHSFEEFRRRLIDVNQYLSIRDRAPFGSVSDPVTGNSSDPTEYVPLDMVEQSNGNLVSLPDFRDELLAPKGSALYVLMGDFGAGKSMTVRELFRRLGALARAGNTPFFPMPISLRDHHGQTNPAEAIMRHAVSMGQDDRQLVRAWRAGYAIPLLDGFDELATARPIGSSTQLRAARFAATELIRRFVEQTPAATPVVITGRLHYFDSTSEMRKCLGSRVTTRILSLNEFTDAQIKQFLNRKGLHSVLPAWLPSRPLLLGYLATTELLKEAVAIGGEESPSRAWPMLLRRICDRESVQANISPDELLQVLQQLATLARQSEDGLGPLTPDALWRTFFDVCGRQPDERGIVQLQRLPGLGHSRNPLIGVGEAETQSRAFVDLELADAARACYMADLASSPFDFLASHDPVFSKWRYSLPELGVEVLRDELGHRKVAVGLVRAAATECAKHEGGGTAAWELLRSVPNVELPLGDREKVLIQGAEIDTLSIDDDGALFDHVTFSKCYVRTLHNGRGKKARSEPVFYGCLFEHIDNAVGVTDLQGDLFDNACEFDSFQESVTTNASILDMNAPLGVRVALTMLRKLFLQRGTGRQESALMRGLDGGGRALAGRVLALIAKHGLVLSLKRATNDVWLPNRSRRAEVMRMIANPNTSADALLAEARLLI